VRFPEKGNREVVPTADVGVLFCFLIGSDQSSLLYIDFSYYHNNFTDLYLNNRQQIMECRPFRSYDGLMSEVYNRAKLFGSS
jgi:hypothetical protein